MRRVILESPYAGDVAANENYARLAIRHCLARGDAPIASHLLFTQPGILDDTVPEERALGMRAGFAWIPVGEASVVYVDRGMSGGMKSGIARAKKHNVKIEFWSIHDTVELSEVVALGIAHKFTAAK